ncbi:DUF4011 domain-containing protein [Candidatus Pelagibacter ubique]|nr:DUF4011 domain-containing protein [Candidatus Pelagibacter ubique]
MSESISRSNKEKINFAKESIAKLRDKILAGATTNRNKLINFKHQDKKRDQIRIVDEVIDEIYDDLSNGKSFTFKPLPEEEKEPKDEQTQKFLDTLEISKREDQVFLNEIEKLGELYDGGNKESLKIERDLKDRVRIQLGLNKRQTVDIIGIEEYAKKHGINPEFELPALSKNELSNRHKDKFIQTILKPKDLERKAYSIKRYTKTALTEKGINTLYLAIGFLEWVESESSDKKILSPLLLMPVELEEKRTKKGSEFIITGGNSDLQVNIVLKAKLEKDFGIILKDFEDEETPEKYFELIKKSINKRDRWDVKKFITLGYFYFPKMAMYYDLDPNNWQDLGSQQSLQDIFSGSDQDSSSENEDYEVDKKEVSSKVPILINSSDASQFSAIVDVMDGKNTAIQGPPGTGKSQTISNIIGAALAKKQTILFCAEKKPALEVVYKKMVAAGLGDFCLKITSTAVRKSEVIANIKKRLSVSKLELKDSNYKIEKAKEEEVKNKLIEYKDILHANIGNSGIKVSDISGFTSKFSSISKSEIFIEIFNNQLDKLGKSFEKITEDEFLLIIDNLKNSEEISNDLLKRYGSISKHPWNGFTNSKINPYDKDKIVKQFISFSEHIEKIENKIQLFTINNPNLKIFNKINCLDDVEKATLNKIENIEKIDKYINFFKKESDLDIIKDLYKKLSLIQDDLKTEKKTRNIFNIKVGDFKKLKNIKDEISQSHFFSFFSSSFRNAKIQYLSFKKEGALYAKENAITELDLYIKYSKIHSNLSSAKKIIIDNNEYKKILGGMYKEEETNLETLNEIIVSGDFIFNLFDKKTLNLILDKPSLIHKINKIKDDLIIDLEKLNEKFEKINIHINEELFFDKTYKLSNIITIKKKIKNLKLELLDEWNNYSISQDSFGLVEKQFKSLIDNHDKGDVSYEELFKTLYYNYLLRLAYNTYPNLTTFDGLKLEQLRKEFKILDKSLSGLKKKKLFNKLANNSITAGHTSGQTKKCTELALIKRITSQKMPRIKLRELIKKSSQALLDMKPCFIMSPTVLSELVVAQEDFFDLLIIDEASQMRMEDSICALARSKQCVIVGDQQQLPPSNQFNANTDDDDEENDLVEESILDLATSRFRANRMLKWHYRSRHESLIDFSNHHFYQNQLIIPPSPITTSAVTTTKVDAYYKGKINIQEKDKLIKDLIPFMSKNIRKGDGDKKSKSCLIVTMNIFQAESIEDDLNKKKLEYPIIEEYENSWKDTGEEFTVKNLESVQGDERDVIFISTLFGPEKPGAKVKQTFGPINHKGGQRRLNVLFTRARQNLHLYTSLSSNDVKSEGTPEGSQIFKAYIEYAKTGKIEIGDTSTGREPPNDFQLFIGEGIKKMGYEIKHEVGVSGFFIDIGVKHKSFPDGFILGVECDGRAYHSSKSARDRDILRQEILEGLGWNIYRIWSTDWFLNPNKELKKLDYYIKELLKKIN